MRAPLPRGLRRPAERADALAFAILLAAALAAGCDARTEAAADPLSKDLRARVEQLKRDVAAAPTTAANVESRAAVLWEWTNAFALAGGMVPVNLTTVPAAVARSRAAKQPIPEDALGELDRYVRELAIKDADADALGPLTVSPAGPLPAASLATIEQTYTVGNLAMKEGGAVLIARQLDSDQGRMQHRDSKGENYVSIRASRAGARWEAIEVPLAGMHGGFRAPEPMPAFRLSGASLVEGDTLTVVYGDQSGGSPGFRLQTWSTDQLLLPIYFDFEGKGDFLTPRWPAVSIEGGKVEAVTAIAPSVVLPGERFALSVRSEDRYSNRATGPKPGYRVLLAGKEVASIPAGGAPSAAALATVPDLRLESPGVYRYEVRSVDGAIATTSNPVWVRSRSGSSAADLLGETHGHTGMAEGQGSASSYWTWARDDGRLDFAALSEHDNWLDDFEWSEMPASAREACARRAARRAARVRVDHAAAARRPPQRVLPHSRSSASRRTDGAHPARSLSRPSCRSGRRGPAGHPTCAPGRGLDPERRHHREAGRDLLDARNLRVVRESLPAERVPGRLRGRRRRPSLPPWICARRSCMALRSCSSAASPR